MIGEGLMIGWDGGGDAKLVMEGQQTDGTGRWWHAADGCWWYIGDGD